MSIVSGVPFCESVDAKLDRAKKHLDIINHDIDSFVKIPKDKFFPKTNPQTNEAWLVWTTDFEQSHPPISISVEIGEFLYNLRSSLDNLVCALVRKEKNTYVASCGGNAFPICTDCDWFDREAVKALHGVPASARTLIQGLQPYSRGAQAADVDPLNILNMLRNRDTHRAVHLGLAYNRNTQFILTDSFTHHVIAHASLPDVVYPAYEPQTIPLPITADKMPAAVDVARGTTAGIHFREIGPWGDRPVGEVLIACMEYVENRVVARFKPFFS